MRVPMQFLFCGGMLALVVAGAAISSQPPAGTEEATKTIPLESCYATFGGSGCQFILRGGDRPHAADLEELLRNNRAGASNLALVRGKDIAQAVRATRWTFSAGQRAEAPALPNPDRDESEGLPLWLAVYFGTGSSEPGFGRVHAAEIRGKTVRVTYSRAKSHKVTADVVHFYLWVPLGRPEAGSYALELFDAVRNEVTLMRRVTVANP